MRLSSRRDEFARRAGSTLENRSRGGTMTDEEQISDLIHRWAVAAHDGDLTVVLADQHPTS
jgi:hypothetical protein